EYAALSAASGIPVPTFSDTIATTAAAAPVTLAASHSGQLKSRRAGGSDRELRSDSPMRACRSAGTSARIYRASSRRRRSSSSISLTLFPGGTIAGHAGGKSLASAQQGHPGPCLRPAERSRDFLHRQVLRIAQPHRRKNFVRQQTPGAKPQVLPLRLPYALLQ